MAKEASQQRIQQQIDRLSRHPLIVEIFSKLQADLPAELTYHSADHSRDVFAETVRFATLEDRTDRELELLGLAAAYHDAGYLIRKENNEEVAAEMLVTALERLGGYSTAEIKLAETLILDTKLVEVTGIRTHKPHCDLSKYLLDADMSNLGRDDFFDRLNALIKEHNSSQLIECKRAVSLLHAHSWFTAIAKELRQPKKDQNMKQLQAMVAALESKRVSS